MQKEEVEAESSDSAAFVSEDETNDVHRSKSNKSLKKYKSNLVKDVLNYGNHHHPSDPRPTHQ